MNEKNLQDERLTNKILTLYDLYRTASYNVLYYGRRLSRTKKMSTIFQCAIILFAPCSAIIWFLKGEVPYGDFIAGGLISLASVAAILKQIFVKDNDIERYTRLFMSYNEIESELGRLSEKIRIDKEYSEKIETRFNVQDKRMATLVALDDPKMNHQEEELCYDKVNKQIPAESLWMPPLISYEPSP